MKRLQGLIAATLITGFVAVGMVGIGVNMDYQQFRAMNSDIILAAEGSADSLPLGFKLTRGFINDSEARFTRFADTSELSR